jgi:hypothetical protein
MDKVEYQQNDCFKELLEYLKSKPVDFKQYFKDYDPLRKMTISKSVFIKVLRKLTSNLAIIKAEDMANMFMNIDG